ncbi:DUF262 domain-containing HNH endonuclease family protein [Campylobacter sp. VBCF_05 NA6]|uniref:DUF262 domain-containing protein n=1 Tax=unclassified Campylobacter TaxID=2593542 RepID=UPI0022E9F97C|nr:MULTISPECIES: DUF262 domain-containing HNH endonuclease family protein [unclassified Campylobacter]MDA3057286.1 DUF262 domain-containing HNH endonuclease family protein [Campylobacter sp. VBCF_04 NA7]MDA3059142.1 DUF262 domain-containing HNH endonuclease family protein [Campylobacter sp. VBCF_05 NA6]
MEARENTFSAIVLQEHKLIIPFFQRTYKWDSENWARLFEDLISSFNDGVEPFLGSIILKRLQGSKNEAQIIDGQQRLTTLSILLKALIDQIDNENISDFKNFLYKPFTKNEIKIQHSLIDREKYSKVLNNENFDQNEETGIFGCYNYFTKKIQEEFGKDEDRKFKFAQTVFSEHKSLVSVFLQDKEDEQKIFDAINSTGVTLSATDIIKNSLFDKIIKETNEEKAIKLYDEYWRNIFEKDDDEQTFWDTTIKTGSDTRTKGEILFHAIAVVKGIFKETDNLSKLSAIYKNHIYKLNEDELINFLKEIKKFALIYRNLPEMKNDDLFVYNYETRFFHICQFTNVKTPFLPIIFILKDEFRDKSDEYKKCFLLMEIFIFFRSICGKRTSPYNKNVIKIIKDYQTNKGIYEILKQNLSDIPLADEVREVFYNISNKSAKFILFWIELCREFGKKDYIDKSGLNYVYELEHIMPQSWQENWSDNANSKDEADKLIYQIGNMALLKGKLNAKVQNSSWKDKRLEYDKYIGNLSINKELLDKEIWDKNKIEQRSENLIKEFFEIWNYDEL